MIDRKKIDGIPYASMLAWFEGGAKALLVLGEYENDGRLIWYSAERQSVTTWGPFITKLLGTDIDLHDTTFVGKWDTDIRQIVGNDVSRTSDFQAPTNRASITTRSTFRIGNLQDIIVADALKCLRKVQEYAVADRRHSYKNTYWIEDATGFCWKSRQLVIPTMPPFNIEITKAPRGIG